MLSKKEIKQLKRDAHHLKPELNVGKEGLTDSFKRSVEEAFNTKDLMKIKVLDTCADDMSEIKSKLEEIDGLSVVHKIGHTLILHKPLEH